ncbi:MAG TPA: hypothetical protein VKR80_07460 [Candidatus Limnocylindria bacterium]|nr:hypothetical protein [Candidatus Limnocylindria bacterium]
MINIQAIGALLHSVTPPVGTLPVPLTSTDGIDCTDWNVGAVSRISFDAATVYITGTAGATLTGPVNIWGFRNGQWWQLGSLDGGANLAITQSGATIDGIARRVDEVAIFTRLAVSCATVTGGVTYTYSFEPIAIRFD